MKTNNNILLIIIYLKCTGFSKTLAVAVKSSTAVSVRKVVGRVVSKMKNHNLDKKNTSQSVQILSQCLLVRRSAPASSISEKSVLFGCFLAKVNPCLLCFEFMNPSNSPLGILKR